MKKNYLKPETRTDNHFALNLCLRINSVGMHSDIPEEDDDWEFGGDGGSSDDPDIRERPNSWSQETWLW